MAGPVYIYNQKTPGQVNQYYSGKSPNEEARGAIHMDENNRCVSK